MTTEEKEGWVYCISNESMPGLLKIGMTDRTPQQRLAEANKSDTWRPPTNFVIEFAKKVKNALQKEKTIHKLLEEYNERVNRSREFFKIDVKKARLYFINDSVKKEINTEINNIIAEKVVNNFETIFNANIKDLGTDEGKKLLTTAFDKASLDIRVGKTYYTFDKLNKIQAKQIKNKIFTAVISSPLNPDMFVTTNNIDSVINQIKYKTDSTFILLDELCRL